MRQQSKTPSEWADWAHDKFHGDRLPLYEIVEAVAQHVYEDCARRAENEIEPASDDELTSEELDIAARTPTLVGMRAAVRTTKSMIASGIRALERGTVENVE